VLRRYSLLFVQAYFKQSKLRILNDSPVTSYGRARRLLVTDSNDHKQRRGRWEGDLAKAAISCSHIDTYRSVAVLYSLSTVPWLTFDDLEPTYILVTELSVVDNDATWLSHTTYDNSIGWIDQSINHFIRIWQPTAGLTYIIQTLPD